MARDCSSSGSPFHSISAEKRTQALSNTGPSIRAVRQLRPPSSEMSTRLTLPRPDQASPQITVKPLACTGACGDGDGEVITDLASISKVNLRALPFSMRSEYFDVSSRVYQGSSPILMRRSHLTQRLPSQPGTTRRAG